MIRWFQDQLADTLELSSKQKQAYAQAAETLFRCMTAIALRRVRAHVREIVFFPSLEELTVELARTDLKIRRLLVAGIMVGGAYDAATQQLFIDGDDLEDSIAGILGHYAHEFTHAIDGPERQISNHPLWKQAWREEVVPQRLSRLALESPREGLAEFGRIMYTEKGARGRLTRKCPLSVEVWKGFGLW
jgi:hypothetical protein